MPVRTKGSGPPLFCVHGQPLRMAQRMNPDRPVYGLSHVYHSDFHDENPESIESLAATYLSEVRQVQPRGPYYLCGFSAGGCVAYEMARQLLKAGETIGNMTLVEPTVYFKSMAGKGKLAMIREGSESRLSFFLELLRRFPRSLKSRIHYMFRSFVVKIYFLLKRPLPESLRWIGYLKSLGPAMSRYTYRPLDCKATFLYGNKFEASYDICCEFWHELILQGATVEIFPEVNKHVDFMVDPALARTVQLIERTHI